MHPTSRFGPQAPDTDNGNPRKVEVDAQWDRIFPAIKALNGTQVRDFLRDIREKDRRIFNALYWRIDDWFTSRIATGVLLKAEADVHYTSETVGQPRMASFVVKTCGQSEYFNGWWQTQDLPRMFSTIDGER